MRKVSRRKFGIMMPATAVMAFGLAGRAKAQFSATYRYFQAVRNGDFAVVRTAIEAPGSTLINLRDRTTGEAALHVITRRRDTQWLLYFLRARANPNIRDGDGNTALHIASQIGYPEGIRWLNVVEADVNAVNNRGETPLILAVQQRNTGIVQQLVDAGADPDITDSVVGMSAMDYATRDTRAATIREILSAAEPANSGQQAIGPTID